LELQKVKDSTPSRLRDDVTPGQLEELAGWLRANA
jgi:hypothetical protein